MAGTPDVYLFIVDSLREDAVDYEPGPNCRTPELASFAERSAVFDTAITHGVGTAPAMTAILTGSLPLAHGGHWWLDEDRWTVAEVLQRAGYRTGAIHTNPNVSRLRNFHQGFDRFEENLLPFVPGRYVGGLPDGVLHAANKAVRLLRRTPYLPASALRRKALQWVEDTDSPRFLWTQFMDVHGPYLSHDRFRIRDKVRAERVWRTATTAPDAVSPDLDRELRENYAAEVSYWDAEFGALLDSLSDRTDLDDTLVVVTSDHGDEFGEHGEYGHGNNAYEEVVRVPLIVNFPGNAYAGRRVSQPVQLVDIVPTLLEACGVEVPTAATGQFIGRPLQRYLDGEVEASAFETVVEKQVRGSDAFRFAIRTDRYKYISDRHEGREELYDLANDPDEQTNVANDCPELLERFRDSIADRVANLPEVTAREGGHESAEARARLEQLGYLEE